MMTIIGLIFAGNLHAGEFFLKDKKSGRTLGPYEYRNGGEVKIGDHVFTLIVKADSAGQVSVKEKLEKIIIPEIDFRNAALVDVLDFLAAASVEYDTLSKEDMKGVNIVVNLDDEVKIKPVTFQARNISMLEVFNILKVMANISYRVQSNTMIVVSGGGEEIKALVTRRYTVPASILGNIRKEGAVEFLSSLGIKFPEGTSAVYNASMGRLVVVNTAENIAVLDEVIGQLGGRSD